MSPVNGCSVLQPARTEARVLECRFSFYCWTGSVSCARHSDCGPGLVIVTNVHADVYPTAAVSLCATRLERAFQGSVSASARMPYRHTATDRHLSSWSRLVQCAACRLQLQVRATACRPVVATLCQPQDRPSSRVTARSFCKVIAQLSITHGRCVSCATPDQRSRLVQAQVHAAAPVARTRQLRSMLSSFAQLGRL
jgi:hypothetical protein